MKKLVLALGLLLPLLSNVLAQAPSQKPALAPCSLTVAQAPAIRGIKLGMSTEEVFAAFPGSSENAEIKSALAKANEYFGVAQFSLYPRNHPTKDRFAGIWSYDFVALDGRVVSFTVQYLGPPAGPGWQRYDDFIAKLAEAFHLPPATDWSQIPSYQGRNLKCNGFTLVALAANSDTSLKVSISDWMKTQEERRAADGEKKRREFKP